MNDALQDVSRELINQLEYSERGPQRNGIFALWLLVNTCAGIIGDHPVQEKNHRKRVAALRKRLSSLSLPPQFRKAIAAALHDLNHDSPRASLVLGQLATPVRDSLGGVCAGLTEQAAKIGAIVDPPETLARSVVETVKQ